MKHKFLTLLLALVAALCLCLGLSACGEGGNGGNGGKGGSVEDGGNNVQEGGNNKPSDACEHVFTAQNVCEKCGEEWEFTEGLEYELDEGTDTYHVINIHKAKGDVVVPYGYQGKFVTAVYGWTREELEEQERQVEYYIWLIYTYDLTDIIMPDSVTEIGDYAFALCAGITSVKIGDGVKKIGESAFLACAWLTDVSIGRGVTSIGERAFWSCYRLLDVWNYSDLNIVAGEVGNGYVGCYAKHVYTTETNISKQTVDGGYVFYEIDDEVFLLGYKGLETQLILPKNSPSGKNYKVYEFAFAGYSGLINIIISDNVTSVGGCAFEWCEGLKSIEIPGSVTEIGECAFALCGELTDIQYEGTVEEWKAIEKGKHWDYDTGNYIVTCTDGTVDKKGNVTYFE